MSDSLYYTVKHKDLAEKSNDAAVLARPGKTWFAVNADIALIKAHMPDMTGEDLARAESTIYQLKCGNRRYDGSRFQSNVMVS